MEVWSSGNKIIEKTDLVLCSFARDLRRLNGLGLAGSNGGGLVCNAVAENLYCVPDERSTAERAAAETTRPAVSAGRLLLRCESGPARLQRNCTTSWSDCKRAALAVQ